MLTDTHCHLDFDAFAADRQSVIERARAAGLGRILDPGIDLPSAQAAIALSEAFPEVFAAVGIHPNSAMLWDDRTLAALRQLASKPKVVAIGEIGLDYYRDRAPKSVQQRVLLAQLDLAAQLGLPVIIHCRSADADMATILSDWQAGLAAARSPLAARPGVLHSFSSALADAQRAIVLGFRIGVTGPVTFHNAANLQELVRHLPLEALLIETDAPFLTPHPHRGRRNEPAYVQLVAQQIAGLHGVAPESVAETTTQNAETLFDWRS